MLEMVSCRIRSICYSDVCYGNPPFPWNLLETQEESFWLCSRLHNLCRLDWITKDAAAYTTERMQHTHTRTQCLQPEGRKKASCSQFLDIVSHINCSPIISDLRSSYNLQPNFFNSVFTDEYLFSMLHEDISYSRKTLSNNHEFHHIMTSYLYFQ